MAFDTVVSIGGQSLIDGVWRLLGPALAGLNNPLPIAIPGFTNAQMRVTQLLPVFPAAPSENGALILNLGVRITGEALLLVTAATEGVGIALGEQSLAFRELAGSVALSEMTASLADLEIAGAGALTGGDVLGPGTGKVRIADGVAAFADGQGSGTLVSLGDPAIPPIPFPVMVPVALDLTPGRPLGTMATIEISVSGPDDETAGGLQFRTDKVVAVADALPRSTLRAVRASLRDAVQAITTRLELPEALKPEDLEPTVRVLLANVREVVEGALAGALTGLLGQTGRLIYPRARTGASCAVARLPTRATAELSASATGNYLLQIGFERSASTDIAAFPAFAPSRTVDCRVQIGNEFLLDLLCCLVERLPAFTLPTGPTAGTSDVNGRSHLACRNFTGAMVSLGGMSIGELAENGISVCIDAGPRNLKTFSIIGAVNHRVPLTPLWGIDYVADIKVGFRIAIGFDLDEAPSLANLRAAARPVVSARVSPNPLLFVGVGAAGAAVIVMINPLLVPGIGAVGVGVAAIFAALGYIGAAVAAFVLSNMARTVLSGASLLRSPVALPPGLFEAFGSFSPARVTIDELVADGVLHTPTAPWALLPKLPGGVPAWLADQDGPDLSGIQPIGFPGQGIPALGIPGGGPPAPSAIRTTGAGKRSKSPD